MKNLKVVSNEPLAKHTYFKLGGPADHFTRVSSAGELEEAVRWAVGQGLPWFILGGGSNILVGDLGIRGLVIKNEARGLEHRGVIVRSESGVLLSRLVSYANKLGMGGLEVFMSVPGTVGGAIYNNSHFRPEKNEFIGNLVKSAEILVSDFGFQISDSRMVGNVEKRVVSRDWFEFGYDYSRLHKEKAVVLTVDFELEKADPEKLRARALKSMARRNQRQPVGEACAGSIFKNPDNDAAGRLIEEAGLKGARVGGAHVSKKHANFIINDGRAKVSDVLELMGKVKGKVWEYHRVKLEPEVFLVGEFSKDVKVHH